MSPEGREGDGHPLDAAAVLEALRERVGARVRPFVTHLPDAEVAALIENIVRIKFKYDGIASLRNTPAAIAPAVRDEPGREQRRGETGGR